MTEALSILTAERTQSTGWHSWRVWCFSYVEISSMRYHDLIYCDTTWHSVFRQDVAGSKPAITLNLHLLIWTTGLKDSHVLVSLFLPFWTALSGLGCEGVQNVRLSLQCRGTVLSWDYPFAKGSCQWLQQFKVKEIKGSTVSETMWTAGASFSLFILLETSCQVNFATALYKTTLCLDLLCKICSLNDFKIFNYMMHIQRERACHFILRYSMHRCGVNWFAWSTDKLHCKILESKHLVQTQRIFFGQLNCVHFKVIWKWGQLLTIRMYFSEQKSIFYNHSTYLNHHDFKLLCTILFHNSFQKMANHVAEREASIPSWSSWIYVTSSLNLHNIFPGCIWDLCILLGSFVKKTSSLLCISACASSDHVYLLPQQRTRLREGHWCTVSVRSLWC